MAKDTKKQVEPTKAPEPQKSRIEILEETVFQLIDKVEQNTKALESLSRVAVKKSAGLFGGKRRSELAIKDTKTGKVYVSKAAVGKVLAGEFNLDPLNHFVWYQIQKAAPNRFVDATTEETEKARAEVKAQLEKEVEEANKRLAEEEGEES